MVEWYSQGEVRVLAYERLKWFAALSLRLSSVFALCVGAAWGQSVASAIQSIVPLQTHRQEIEALLGSPEQSGTYWQFKTADMVLNAVFSTGRCVDAMADGSRFDVEKEIVLSYQLVIRRQLPLSDLGLDLTEYSLDESGDLINFVTYRNPRDGIEIVVGFQEDLKLLKSIRRRPSERNAERYRCGDCDRTAP